jgi:hypothetical protein
MNALEKWFDAIQSPATPKKLTFDCEVHNGSYSCSAKKTQSHAFPFDIISMLVRDNAEPDELPIHARAIHLSQNSCAALIWKLVSKSRT